MKLCLFLKEYSTYIYNTLILDHLLHGYPVYYLSCFFLTARVLCSKFFRERDFIIVKIVLMNFVKNIIRFTKKEMLKTLLKSES